MVRSCDVCNSNDAEVVKFRGILKSKDSIYFEYFCTKCNRAFLKKSEIQIKRKKQ